jgi:hypothetical protein
MVQLSHYGNTVAIDGNSPIEDEYWCNNSSTVFASDELANMKKVQPSNYGNTYVMTKKQYL